MRLSKRFFILLSMLCILFGILQGAAAANIMLTAVNDQLLPLSDNTMPIRRNGEYYVPYQIFSGALGVNATMPDNKTLLLYNLDNTVTFSLQNNAVYDESGTSYQQPAYSVNDTVYVPVKLVCGLFGLSYSSITGTWPILRVVNEQATLSDHAFLTSMESAITAAVNRYQNVPDDSPSSTDTSPAPAQTESPDVMPVTPPTENQSIPQPEKVYLCIVGTPSEYTASMLDSLSEFDGNAAFFLAADGLDGQEDIIREIFAAGHTIGLSFTAQDVNPQTMLTKIEQANDILEQTCGIRTRLVMALDNAASVTQAQREALVAAGYRLWRTTLDGAENSRSAYHAAEIVLTMFQNTNDAIAVRLRQQQNSPQELRYLLTYLQTTKIPNPLIYLTTEPV